MKKRRLITLTALLVLGILSACGSKEAETKKSEVASESSVTEQSISTSISDSKEEEAPTSADSKAEKVPTSAPDSKAEKAPTSAPDSKSEQVPTVTSAPQTREDSDSVSTEEAGLDSKEENAYLRIEKCSAKVDQDYLHVSYDPITLGNGENLTLTITATPANLRAEDFFISYDSSLLSSEITDVSSNESANETTVKVAVSAINPGTSDLYILSSYDLAVLPEEEWRGISYSIRGLDSNEGQIVFVTPTGEKYHLSADCAGENAIGTTLYDAVADEYGPCGKCAG